MESAHTSSDVSPTVASFDSAAAIPSGGREKHLGISEGQSVVRGAGGRGDPTAGGGAGPGLRKVREYIAKTKPKGDGPSGPSWQEVQLEPTPTLLPELRYAIILPLGKGKRESLFRSENGITLIAFVTSKPSRVPHDTAHEQVPRSGLRG